MAACYGNPFESEGMWFKGNLHTHTNVSDGRLLPEEVARQYHVKGYQFLAISDHDKLTKIKNFSEPGFILLNGEELCCGTSKAGTGFHILAINIDKEISIEEHTSPQEAIDIIRNCGGEAIIAHPYWCSLTVEDLLSLKRHIGIEVFNTTCLLGIGRGHSFTQWDDLLTRGRLTLGFSVDDSHQEMNEYHPLDAFEGWIMVKAGKLNSQEIMSAIRDGKFYSSSGPEIKDITVSEKEITVKTSPVKVIDFIADRCKGKRFTAESTLESAAYNLSGEEKYIRIQCIDENGKMAFSNPVVWNV